jgi:hypothetical protein
VTRGCRWLPGALLFALACASAPRLRVLGEADTVRKSPAATTARPLAPQAAAYADRLLADAEKSQKQGDVARSQILGERAIASYHHMVALARLAAAERRLELARAERTRIERSLADLTSERRRVAAEAEDLELRARVVRDAVPIAHSRPTTPEREQARRDAARALGTQARLLCVATRMLDPKAPTLGADLAALDSLDGKLRQGSGGVPIDEALRLRSACLHALTLARRGATHSSPAAGGADELLADLGRLDGLYPYRDDRGVVVTLRGLFAPDGTLSPAARPELDRLRVFAKAHPDFPLLAVLHSASGPAGALDERRGQALREALRTGPDIRVETQAAGSSEPLVDPKQPGARARNERVEIIFVCPTS